MKPILITFLALLTLISSPVSKAKDQISDDYDEKLAKELGADDYGMHSYVFVVLKTGPNDAIITDKEKRKAIFSGHFSNMGKLAKEGKLVLAGPFVEGGNKRGMYIFKVTDIDDAKALVETDPAVEAGIFIAEYTKYYGSAALNKVNEIHNLIQKTKIE